MPFTPVDFQQLTSHAELMKAFGCLLLIAVMGLADGTGDSRATRGREEPGEPVRASPAALAENPHHLEVLHALGQAEFRAGHYRAARKYFDQALRVAGDGRVAVLTHSAMASIALGDSRRAESSVREALELAPQNCKVLKVLAQALYLQKRYREAKVLLEKILTIESDPIARGDLATLYQAERKNSMAMDLLQQAVSETNPGQARARLLANLGVMQWESGLRERGEKTLLEALGEAEATVGPEHPDTARILERYGQVLRRNGRKEEANKAADRAVAIRALSASQTNENGFTVDWRDSGRR